MTAIATDDGIGIGDYIRKARRTAHLEQKDLAAEVGVSRALVSLWECGHSVPAATKIPLIAKATNRPILFFYGQSDLHNSDSRWNDVFADQGSLFDLDPPDDMEHARGMYAAA